jgi:hypothetical protein
MQGVGSQRLSILADSRSSRSRRCRPDTLKNILHVLIKIKYDRRQSRLPAAIDKKAIFNPARKKQYDNKNKAAGR